MDIGDYRGARIELQREVGRLPVVYRHLDDPQYARDFVERGNFRLSTAGSCRQAEGDARKDAGEGHDTHVVSRLSGDDPQVAHMVPEWAINQVVPGMTFTDVSFNRVHDSFLLCLTDLDTPEIREDFGEESVRIVQLDRFFWKLVRKMAERYDLQVATLARVRYGDRVLRDYQQGDCPPMYRKPMRFSNQNEIRISFQVGPRTPRPLDPFVVDCPDVARFCTLVERNAQT